MQPSSGVADMRVRLGGRPRTPALRRRSMFAGAVWFGLLTAACSGQDSAGEELSRAQRDSLAARLPIPGASGVGAALRARDALDDRATAHDSIGR